MKKKNRKRRKRRQSARHAAPGVPAKRRYPVKRAKAGSASAPWLRMFPVGIEEDSRTKVSRGSLFVRNGRRHLPDFDLYMLEEDSRSR
jgi:hypothetical protein